MDASNSDWPGWRRIPDLQVFNCPLDVAIDPALVVPAIKWIPCTDGRPNCEEIDGTPFSPEVIKFPNGWFSRDGRAFMLAHFIQSNIIGQYSIYDAKTLAPLAAWRGKHGPSPFCDVNTEFSETKMGVLYATSLDGGPISRLIDVNTPIGLMTKPALLALSATGDTSSVFVVSDTTFAFSMNLSGSIVRGLTGTSTFVRTNWPYRLNTPIVVGDDVYAVNEHGTGDGWYREGRIVADASVSIFREAPQRHITGMVTDGNDWYWAESYGSGNPNDFVQPNVEIYTSPYTNDPIALDNAKKKIATLPPGLPFASTQSPRHAIFQAIPGQTEVFRASDGHRTTIVNQGTGWCAQPLLATDTEFWCIERLGKNGPDGVKVTKIHLTAW